MNSHTSKLPISLVQMDISWENINQNLTKLDALLKKVPTESEIIVLPEMFSTGFTMNTQHLPQPLGYESFEWLKAKSKELNKIIIGSILTEENGKYYNRMYWMNPNGTYTGYDKRHLFHMGGEHKVMTAGTKQSIVKYKDLKFMLQICYDLRFPVWSKNKYNKKTGEYKYDVLIYIANWPESRKHAYLNLLKARAIENQSFVIWVNRIGEDNKGNNHSGDTQLIDPSGEVLFKSKAHEEEILETTIEKETVKKLRENFKVGLDWDDFIIKF